MAEELKVKKEEKELSAEDLKKVNGGAFVDESENPDNKKKS